MKILKFLKSHKFKFCSFAVEHGKYCGELFVFIEEKDNNYFFISLPKKEIRQCSIKQFKLGEKEKILKFVEKLPKDVYKICQLQYEKLNNRFKQSNSQNISHK